MLSYPGDARMVGTSWPQGPLILEYRGRRRQAAPTDRTGERGFVDDAAAVTMTETAQTRVIQELQAALDELEGPGYRIALDARYGYMAYGETRPYNLSLGDTLETACIEIAYRQYLNKKYPRQQSGAAAR